MTTRTVTVVKDREKDYPRLDEVHALITEQDIYMSRYASGGLHKEPLYTNFSGAWVDVNPKELTQERLEQYIDDGATPILAGGEIKIKFGVKK